MPVVIPGASNVKAVSVAAVQCQQALGTGAGVLGDLPDTVDSGFRAGQFFGEVAVC